MKNYPNILMLCLLLSASLYAHEGHHQAVAEVELVPVSFGPWINWIGTFHLVVLHFPIALTYMTVVAELLLIWTRRPLFEQAAYFMIVSAAIWAPPTALLGWALSYGNNYTGLQLELFEWHRYFGIVTTLLAIATAYLRYSYMNEKSESLTLYYFSLFFLFISVSLTGVFGGSLAF